MHVGDPIDCWGTISDSDISDIRQLAHKAYIAAVMRTGLKIDERIIDLMEPTRHDLDLVRSVHAEPSADMTAAQKPSRED